MTDPILSLVFIGFNAAAASLVVSSMDFAAG
jgi:hypothetical protein